MSIIELNPGLERDAAVAVNRGLPCSDAPEPQGRGVWEVTFTDRGGFRMFVALNEGSVAVAKGYLEEGGDEWSLRDEMTERLIAWELRGGLAVL